MVFLMSDIIQTMSDIVFAKCRRVFAICFVGRVKCAYRFCNMHKKDLCAAFFGAKVFWYSCYVGLNWLPQSFRLHCQPMLLQVSRLCLQAKRLWPNGFRHLPTSEARKPDLPRSSVWHV